MHFQFHRRDPSTKCVLSYTGIFSGTIREPKYQGTSISTSFVESENPLWINFGSIPASVRWIELFEKLSEELKSPDRNKSQIWIPKFRGNLKNGGTRSKIAVPTFYPRFLPPIFHLFRKNGGSPYIDCICVFYNTKEVSMDR